MSALNPLIAPSCEMMGLPLKALSSNPKPYGPDPFPTMRGIVVVISLKDAGETTCPLTIRSKLQYLEVSRQASNLQGEPIERPVSGMLILPSTQRLSSSIEEKRVNNDAVVVAIAILIKTAPTQECSPSPNAKFPFDCRSTISSFGVE